MQIQVRGNHMDIGDSFSQYIEEHVTETCEKFFNHAVNAQVSVQPDAHSHFKADIMLSVGNGIIMRASGTADEPYPSFDQALDKLARQLRKYKDRLKDHHTLMQEAEDTRMAASQYVIEVVPEEPEDGGAEHADSDEPVIIAETQTNIETLSVSEAVMRMDIEDLPALMFRNRSHDGLNMLYKRTDGHIGWVDPRGNSNA